MDLIPAIYEYLNTDEAQLIRAEFVKDEISRMTSRIEEAARKLAKKNGVEFGGLFKDANGNFYNDTARQAYNQIHGEDN